MSVLRVGLVLGVLVAASACGGDDDTAGTSTPTSRASTTIETTTTESSTTTESPTTTEPVATTEPEPSTTAVPSATTVPATTTTASSTTTTVPALVDVKVYFFRGERIEIAHRQVEGPAVLRGALAEVLAGPTVDERAAGLTSEIPAGTTLRGVTIADGQATVDVTGEYESGGGSLSMMARLASVVFTATQFDNVDRVLFWLDGAPVEFFGGEGIVLDEPLARMDMPWDFTGGVIVDVPEPGATVRSPFTVTGEGDLFEGDSAMWVWRDGVRVAGPFLVQAGAWGMWAEFETVVTLDLPPGPIELILDYGNGCTPGDPECGEPILTIVPLDLVG